jgi:hypothetical protein
MSEGWPVALRGVTESVVTTLGPNDRWNVAALGLHAPDGGDGTVENPVTARTWGRTRTWRNFRERGAGYIQFTTDPLTFAEAAMTVREESEPVLPSADAWARVTVERVDSGAEGDTEWAEWALDPEETAVERESVPTTNRGYYAVIEATVAASRLDVPAYDRAELASRLDYFAEVVDRCGGERERAAMAVVRDNCSWDG